MKVRYFNQDVGLVMVEGAEAAGIIAVEKLNLIMGEWFLDTEAGIPWIPEILGNKATQATINFIGNYIYNELSTIPEITGVNITTLDLDPKTRRLKIAVTLTHQDKQINLEETYGI